MIYINLLITQAAYCCLLFIQHTRIVKHTNVEQKPSGRQQIHIRFFLLLVFPHQLIIFSPPPLLPLEDEVLSNEEKESVRWTTQQRSRALYTENATTNKLMLNKFCSYLVALTPIKPGVSHVRGHV
jgi:hypothetical protein